MRDLPFGKENDISPKKHIYRVGKSTSKEEFVADIINPYYQLGTIGDNVFFTGDNDITTDDEKMDLYMVDGKNKTVKKIAENVKKVVNDSKHIAYTQIIGQKTKLTVIDDKSNVLGQSTIPNWQVGIFLSADELIAWSWQDKKVRYYNLSY